MRKPFLAGLAISRSLKPTKVAMATIPMVSAAWAQAEEITAPGPLNETKPAEVRIVSTEFGYAPAKVMVIAGRAMTLVLDNSAGETEHDLVVPAFGFRLQAKAGETARKSTVFEEARRIRIQLRSARPPRCGNEGYADRPRFLTGR
jgi:hypothetical protein